MRGITKETCLSVLILICQFQGRFSQLIEAQDIANNNSTSGEWKTTTPDSQTGTWKHLQPNVTCSPDVIDISISRQWMSRGVERIISPDYIIFSADASEHCRATMRDNGDYWLKIDLRSKFLCGSSKKITGYQTEYRNQVVLLDSEAGEIRSLVNVSCIYRNDDHIVIMGPDARKITRRIGEETAEIEMNIYRDKSYSDDAKFDDGVPQISVGHFLFVSVDLVVAGNRNYDNFNIVANSCFASYYADRSDRRMIHKFITNGCADNLDSTVSIQSNGNGFASRWKFQMFKWVNTTSQRIYLYCQVDICDETKFGSEGTCNKNKTKKNCFGRDYGRRDRRDLGGEKNLETELDVGVLSIGPIYPKDSLFLLEKPKGNAPNSGIPGTSNYEEESKQIVPIAVGVVLAVCAVMLSISGYLMWKRYVARKNERREQNKKKIEQGFAFVMKSSEDPDIFGLCEKEKTNPPSSTTSKTCDVSRSLSREKRREVCKEGERFPDHGNRRSKRRHSKRKMTRNDSERGSIDYSEVQSSENRNNGKDGRGRGRSSSMRRSKSRDLESSERQNDRTRHRTSKNARRERNRRARSTSHTRSIDHTRRQTRSSSFHDDH